MLSIKIFLSTLCLKRQPPNLPNETLSPQSYERDTSLDVADPDPHHSLPSSPHPQPTTPPPIVPAPAPPNATPNPPNIVLDSFKITQAFINALKSATLDDGNLDAHTLDQLRNPIQEVLHVEDPDVILSIRNFISLTNASDQAYTDIRSNILQRYPESGLLSHYLVKQKIEDLTGVVSVTDDMCWQSCVGFTGPYEQLDHCPDCGDTRWDPIRLAESGGETKVARQKFHTILLGPQLQALWRSPEGAKAMRYRTEK
ncbi:hypothetical protein C8R43DRAFT_893885, partial [Mycena crocata]